VRVCNDMLNVLQLRRRSVCWLLLKISQIIRSQASFILLHSNETFCRLKELKLLFSFDEVLCNATLLIRSLGCMIFIISF
jgi:hypothetical protein